jgi:hypothetical protein
MIIVEIPLTELGCIHGYHKIVFAKDQLEYIPLPAISDGNKVITKWKLTKEELEEIAITGELYLEILTFGQPLQPIKLSTILEEVL